MDCLFLLARHDVGFLTSGKLLSSTLAKIYNVTHHQPQQGDNFRLCIVITRGPENQVASGCVTPKPCLLYLHISGLLTKDMPMEMRFIHLRSKPESRAPFTWQVKAPCARTVMEKGLANFLSHATFTSSPLCPIARSPGLFGPLASRRGATQLPSSQRLCDELGMAPLQEGLGYGVYAGGRNQAWLFGDVTPMMVPPFGRILLPKEKMT